MFLTSSKAKELSLMTIYNFWKNLSERKWESKDAYRVCMNLGLQIERHAKRYEISIESAIRNIENERRTLAVSWIGMEFLLLVENEEKN
jgi:hypothetical protein